MEVVYDAQKGAPKVHFRACKVSISSGPCQQAPHTQLRPSMESRHHAVFVNYATDPGAYYRVPVPLEVLAGQHWYFADKLKGKHQKKNSNKQSCAFKESEVEPW